MRYNRILSIYLIIILGVLSSSITAATYRITHYDDHNGMSQWHLTRILQDSRGFIWFATWNGLNRYDGYDFAIFKSQPGDGNNLTSDRIRNMLLGDDGNIYCVINETVWRFNLSTYRFEQPENRCRERYQNSIRRDMTVKKEACYEIGGQPFEHVRQVFTDSQGNRWIMGRYGVHKVSTVSQPSQIVTKVPSDIIRCVFVDADKRIWVTSRNQGVVTVLDSLANFIGYLGRDGILHPNLQRFAPVYCMTQCKNGKLWLGTKPEGLFSLTETTKGRFNIQHFCKGTPEQVKRGETINCNDIYDIKEDRNGQLWIATHGGGLNLMQTRGGKPCFRNYLNTFFSYPKGNLHIRRLLIVGDTLMLGTTTEGFFVAKGIDKQPEKVSFNLHLRESKRVESLSSSAVMDMLIDRKGRLFISTESGGVNMLMTKDMTESSLSFKHFNTQNGLGSDVALAMAEVGDEILVQCNNLVARINADTEDIENFNDLFFSAGSRFSDAEPVLLSDGRWLLTQETGLLIMPEQSFHQRRYVPRIVITSVSVPGRSIDYSADGYDTLRLSSTERDVTIQYAALDFTDNSHIKYTTRMIYNGLWNNDNDTTQWSMPADTRTLNFYNLAPGTYRLEIRSTNAEGLWTDNTRTMIIEVKPSFWETPLAYIFYFLTMASIVAGITYTLLYIRTLKRQREENLQAYLQLFEQQITVGQTTTEQVPELYLKSDSVMSPVLDTIPVLPRLSDEDTIFMQRLLTFVEDNLGNSNVGVDDIAVATATSRSSLNRKIKALLGVTPADFLKEARMKRACRQLLTTSKSINDIAYYCGFSDPKYFSKCFKASFNMSPTEYRGRTDK